MQSLLLPVGRTGVELPAPPRMAAGFRPSQCLSQLSLGFNNTRDLHSSLSSLKLLKSSSSSHSIPDIRSRKTLSFAPIGASYSFLGDDSEYAKLAQVSMRLQKISRSFKRLGSFGFWGQLICTVVAAVILSFSNVITGKISSPVTFYATAAGIAASFISVFWSFGYIRLSDTIRRAMNNPSKAPTRADVVRSLRDGIVVNMLGMGAAILGMQAKVGLLVAKALTTSANAYYSAGSSPVLGLDIFLVQASANTILSHFLGLLCSMELLRSITSPERGPTPKTTGFL